MIQISKIPICIEHDKFNVTCLKCWILKHSLLLKDLKKLQGLVAERLPENTPSILIDNWDNYLDDWEDQVRHLLGKNYE